MPLPTENEQYIHSTHNHKKNHSSYEKSKFNTQINEKDPARLMNYIFRH